MDKKNKEFNKFLENADNLFYEKERIMTEKTLEKIIIPYKIVIKKNKKLYTEYYNDIVAVEGAVISKEFIKKEVLVNNKRILSEVADLIGSSLKGSLDLAFKSKQSVNKEFFDGSIKVNGAPKKTAEAIINAKYYGLNWEQRTVKLWNSLNDEIVDIIFDGLEAGNNPNIIGGIIEKRMNINSKRAMTIARTESSRVFNHGKFEALKTNPYIDKILIIATTDDRTTQICRDKDGLILNLKDITTDDLPPYHPNCRTTFSNYVDQKLYKRMKNKDRSIMEYDKYRDYEKKYGGF